MPIITLGLSDMHPMELKYPGWWEVHQAALEDTQQRPDPFCPVCRELIGAEAQDRLLADVFNGRIREFMYSPLGDGHEHYDVYR